VIERVSASFDEKLSWARESEEMVGAFLRSRGWWCIPTYDFSGKGDNKAPKLLAPVGEPSLVLPDLQCFRDGERRWYEVKRKSSAASYRIGGYPTTGISQRHFDQYLRVQDETRSEVVIVFVHEHEAEIRGDTLDGLERSAYSHTYGGSAMGGGGMRFWRYDQIRLWCAMPRRAAVADGQSRLAGVTGGV